MGWSGQTGRVDVSDVLYYNNIYSAQGDIQNVQEVISWEMDDHANLSSYLHSESSGWYDIAPGGRFITGSIEVKLVSNTYARALEEIPIQIYAGRALRLTLENAALRARGFAYIESIPISTKIDQGEPVSATYRFRSAGAWSFYVGTHSDGNE